MLQFLWLNSCIEEYWPEIDKYENLLVVEGGISNTPPPYLIRLSRSAPVDSAQLIPFTRCSVIINSDEGEYELLTEIEQGVYASSPQGIWGKIGNSYKLSIITNDRKEYQTKFEELKEPVKIEDVYAETEFHFQSGYDHTLSGYQFYLNTEETQSDTNYYLWRLEATYQYQSDYNIRWYYDGSHHRFSPADSLFNCWKTIKIREIYTFNTSSLSNNKLDHFPLNYANTENRQLTVRYSLLVNQFTIDKSAYSYWSAIEKQNSDQGSLYSHQPYQVRGNVRNMNDEEEPVLGYFTVGGVDKKRIFVDKIDTQFYFTKCSINQGHIDAVSNLMWTPHSHYPVYVVQYGTERAVPNQVCADCRKRKGTINRPYFWKD